MPVAFSPMHPTPVRPAALGHANLDLVHDVPLEISAVLGQTELSLREVVSMQTGSVFELDKLSTEPIEGRGEVSHVGERQREQMRARSQTRAQVVEQVRVVTREEVAAERVAVVTA